jgi:hypothetical protein
LEVLTRSGMFVLEFLERPPISLSLSNIRLGAYDLSLMMLVRVMSSRSPWY